jgi:hypothetical protein
MAGIHPQLTQLLAGVVGVDHPKIADHDACRSIGVVEATNCHSGVGRYGAADPHHLFVSCKGSEGGDDFCDAGLGRSVEHYPECALLVVLDHQHHGSPEEVVQAGGGDQQLAPKRVAHPARC